VLSVQGTDETEGDALREVRGASAFGSRVILDDRVVISVAVDA
jgi:hypothetical protein